LLPVHHDRAGPDFIRMRGPMIQRRWASFACIGRKTVMLSSFPEGGEDRNLGSGHWSLTSPTMTRLNASPHDAMPDRTCGDADVRQQP